MKNIIYAVSAFCVFIILTYILRLISGKFPEDSILFGIYKTSDFVLGGAIALILTYTRYTKRNSTKK